jgi:hypothetical protein
VKDGIGREVAGQFGLRFRLPRKSQGSFTFRKSATRDRRLYFPSKGRHVVDFSALLVSVFFPSSLVPKTKHFINQNRFSPQERGWRGTSEPAPRYLLSLSDTRQVVMLPNRRRWTKSRYGLANYRQNSLQMAWWLSQYKCSSYKFW